MLEALIHSRVRRALFEHIVQNPTERFYLRGLAKTLHLSVSPLRRELKRLETSGLLRSLQEGNMVFYQVDPTSAVFQQLQQAATSERTQAPSPAPSVAGTESVGPVVMTQSLETEPSAPFERLQPSVYAPDVAARSTWRSPLSPVHLLVATGVGLGLMICVIGLATINWSQQQLVAETSKALRVQQPKVTVVVPPQTNASASASSGAMKSGRWQIVPGAFGGFGSGSSEGRL